VKQVWKNINYARVIWLHFIKGKLTMTDKQIIIEDYFNIIRDDYGRIYCIQEIGEAKELIKAIREQNEYIQRKEQECEELKKANKHIEHSRNQKADKLMRIEKLITACSTGYTDEFIQELLIILHEPEPVSFENKYLQALKEIKEIANSQVWRIGDDKTIEKINQIISEII
jgi:hypothetical protein